MYLYYGRTPSREFFALFHNPCRELISGQPFVIPDRNKQVKPVQVNEHCLTKQMVSEMKDILPTAVFNSFKADFPFKLSNIQHVPLLKTEP